MSCIKNTIVFIAVLITVLNLFLLAQCGRVKRVVGAMDADCGIALSLLVFRVPYLPAKEKGHIGSLRCPSVCQSTKTRPVFSGTRGGTQPGVASLRNSSNLRHLCGATILSPHFALTAAHCVLKDENQYILQLNNYCVEGDGPLPKAEVLEIIKHQQYDPITRAHDVALLRVALHLGDVTWLNRSLLPTSSFGISGECTIYGYGYKDVDSMETSERLLSGTLRIVSLDECTGALGPYLAPRYDSGMMCAVGDGVDACQGDSGSPLICSGGVIEAVSSYGMSCAVPGLPGIYTSIGAHLPWIRELMTNE